MEQTDIKDNGLDAEQAVKDGGNPQAEQGGDNKSEMHTVKVFSPGRLVLRRFFRSKLSVIGLTIFILMFFFVFLGPVFVGWGETEVDHSGGGTVITPYVVEFVGADCEVYTVYQINEFVRQDNTYAAPFSYGTNANGKRVIHLFGTDNLGRDVLVRLMYGGRVSLIVSFLAVILSAAFGIVLGGLAGYFGKWVDNVIMRVVDAINCIPTLPILLIFSAILDAYKDVSPWVYTYRIYIVMGVLTLLSWTGTARLVRGQILFLREQEYMVAAEALGMSPVRKIFKHLVINVVPQLVVSMTLGLGGMILYEATLGFLDLGVPIPYASWGNMISLANDITILQYYVNMWLPAGLAIILTVLAFNFIGDGLRDALDPKMKR